MLEAWAFLEPWRRILRPFVQFEDHEELLASSLHERLSCVRVNLFNYEDEADINYGDGRTRTIRAGRQAFFTKLHEALELIGLALHYDKRVWRWLRPKYGLLSFNYDESSTFELLYEFTMHDVWWGYSGDRGYEFTDTLALIARTDTRSFRDVYVAAKAQLQNLVGDRYDPEYRIPVSLVLAPRAPLNNDRVETDAWYASVHKFVSAVRAPAYAARSCFEFKAITLLGWQLRVDESLTTLLSEVVAAQIQIPELSFKLIDTHEISSGRAFNQMCGRDVGAARLVDDVGVHESALRPFIQVCTSLMEATWPRRLVLYEAFGQNPVERATKWRWLGYALSGDHVVPTSIQHLRIEDSRLLAADVRDFIGDATDRSCYAISPPSGSGMLEQKRCVQLSPDACIFVGGECWQTLRTLGMTNDELFVVIEDAADVEDQIAIVVPGFGLCEVQCASVIDAIELPASSSSKFQLSSLQCGINTCEPEALRLLTKTFGRTLTRLKLSLGDEIALTRPEAIAFVESFTQLQFLDLNHVSLGSMDVLVSAYEGGVCRVSALSLTNSYVEPASLTRFARLLADVTSRVAQCLRDFRFMFEDFYPSASGECPTIITTKGGAAFREALRKNSLLKFVELGLTQTVYDQFFDSLMSFDKVEAAKRAQSSKLALLSVLCGRSSCRAKKPRCGGVACVPRRHRQAMLSGIWQFLEPRARRIVSVICVPREADPQPWRQP